MDNLYSGGSSRSHLRREPQLAARPLAERQVAVDSASLSRFLCTAGYAFKKTLLADEANRADVAETRRTWRDERQGRVAKW
jgi:hypothetical protein